MQKRKLFYGDIRSLEGISGRLQEVQGTIGRSKAPEGITAFHFYRLLMNHRRV